MLARVGLSPGQQLALFRTRLLLSVRQFSKEPGKILGLIISALVFIPLSIGAGFGTGYGYLNLPDAWPTHLLAIVFVVAWLIWAVIPVLLFGSNEAMDMTRLLLYPLSKRDLVVSTFAGTIFDFTSYLLIPILLAPLVRWSSWPTLPVLLIGLLVCYAHLMVINQLTLIAAGGILRSRRFRDVMIVVLSLVGFSCYFVQTGVGYLMRQLDVDSLATLQPLRYLQWHPTGAIARSVQLAEGGSWMLSTAWMLYSIAWILLFLWIWQTLFRRIVTGQGFLHTGFGVKREERAAAAKAASAQPQQSLIGKSGVWRLWGWLPYASQQIFIKELKSIWRVPQRRIGLIQGLILPVFLTVPGLMRGGAPPEALQYIWLILPVYAIFTTWVFGMNMLGWEGRSLATLFAMPIKRWVLLSSKCLALFCLVMLPISLLTIAVTILLRNFMGLYGLLVAMGATGAILGLMVVASVLFPYPVNLESYRQQMSLSGGSCVATLVNMLVVPLFLGLMVSPLMVGIGAAFLLQRPEWIPLTALLAPLYGAVIFGVSAFIAAHLLSTREPEVLQATRVADGSA